MANCKYISKKIERLTKKYGTRCPFELCGELGISIKYSKLCPQIKAFFFYQSRIKTIVLNEENDTATHKVLCAHELGHALLHSDLLITMRSLGEFKLFDVESISEYEANLFAAELLIEDEELLSLAHSGEYSIFQIASMLYIPAELIDFKLRMLQSKGYEVDVPFIATAKFLKDKSYTAQ